MESTVPTEAPTKYSSFLKEYSFGNQTVPFLKDLWQFFSEKGVKTNFFSVNPATSYTVDLEICEALGCPIRVLTNSTEVEAKWTLISKTLKARKIAEEDSQNTWLDTIYKRWVLPRNIIVKNTPFTWTTLQTEVVTLENQRVDLFKVECSDESDYQFLYSLLSSGYRPGVVLVRYYQDPDENVPAMLVAGHFQMCGYQLAACKGNWFLYIFEDACLYESCSWRNTRVRNPMVSSLAEVILSSQASKTSEASTAVPDAEKKEN